MQVLVEVSSGNFEWRPVRGIAGGAVPVAAVPMTFVKYSGSGYTYFCEAIPGSALSDEVWQVMRKDDSTGEMVYAGTGGFAHAATDLATVAALTYDLGA